MTDGIVGIGVDLTQHVPLVSVALCPDAISESGNVDIHTLARSWPPRVEFRGSFLSRPPTAILPILGGEPLLVGEAAAAHRRSAGLPWPPEAQVPYAGNPTCGLGRIPLVAAWTALLPKVGEAAMLVRREDPEFKWRPDGCEYAARASQIIAGSIKAFLDASCVPSNSCFTAIVVPDGLDEGGQQILLDSLKLVGLDKVHLLPRPVAVALDWCSAHDKSEVIFNTDDEEGKAVGRLRVLTMALDGWEAVSLELRVRRYEGCLWLEPVRDRACLHDALPELQVLGLSYALALAHTDAKGDRLGWWFPLFANDWLAHRLAADRDLTPQELQAICEVHLSSPPESLRQELDQLHTLQPLWSRMFCNSPPLKDSISQRWDAQERQLETAALPCLALLADGVFTGLRIERGATLAQITLPPTEGATVQTYLSSQPAAVAGAALAAAAIAHGLPCYRETLLPLDLYVQGQNDLGDPTPQWRELVAARSVEAGLVWRSPMPVTGLRIRESTDRLLLPLRRALRGRFMYRKVSTALTLPARREEAVRVEVAVKPGQGFARVRIESVSPGVFTAMLDWRTMQECAEPERPKLAYLPGVSRVVPDRELFARAQPAMRAALDALQRGSPTATERLRELIVHLNKSPLAHYVESGRGHRTDKDFMLHYGVIGSEGELQARPEPGLPQALRDKIGERFSELINKHSPLGKTLLRAGGWFYLAMPKQCFAYLRNRLIKAEAGEITLSAVELHAIGLGLNEPRDLRIFYPLVLRALMNPNTPPNNWLRAVRNICRFRNSALSPDAIPDRLLLELVVYLHRKMRDQDRVNNYARIFCNCLEAIPFLLKRRRHDPSFLTPHSQVASQLIHFLETVDRESRLLLPRRFQAVPRATINFLKMQATTSDVEELLGLEEETDDDD